MVWLRFYQCRGDWLVPGFHKKIESGQELFIVSRRYSIECLKINSCYGKANTKLVTLTQWNMTKHPLFEIKPIGNIFYLHRQYLKFQCSDFLAKTRMFQKRFISYYSFLVVYHHGASCLVSLFILYALYSKS